MDEHAPLLTKHIRVKHSSPWYNQELNEYKKLKRKAEKVWLKSRSNDDWNNFKKLIAEYISMCNMAKTVFYSDEFNKCEGNQRKLYKLIRKLTDGDKNLLMVRVKMMMSCVGCLAISSLTRLITS